MPRPAASPRPRSPRLRALPAAVLALALAGCGGGGPDLLAPKKKPVTPEEIRTHFASWHAEASAMGRMREDTAPADAPFDKAALARNFDRIALRREGVFGGEPVNDAPVRKFERPLRWRTYPAELPRREMEEVRALFARISALTGLRIRQADGREAELSIWVMDKADRARNARTLRAQDPDATFLKWVANEGAPCFGTVFGRPGEQGFNVFIRREVQGPLRISCYHEEIVQGFGLMNDHPNVRPSMFNDDEEFALLTRHDEWLLRILYDPRLKNGMRRGEAMPIVAQILSELDLRADPAAGAARKRR